MLRRRMLSIATVLGLTYLGLGALLFLLQRALLFPAPREAAALIGKGEILQVPGGTPMLWRPAAGTGPVVVHFHGNGEQIASEAWLGEELARRGVSFAAVEYPGYPRAAGVPSEEGIVAAAEKALQHLTTTMGVSPERVVLSGQSLGTGVAVVLASRGWGTRTALLSPYTSLPAVAASGILRRSRSGCSCTIASTWRRARPDSTTPSWCCTAIGTRSFPSSSARRSPNGSPERAWSGLTGRVTTIPGSTHRRRPSTTHSLRGEESARAACNERRPGVLISLPCTLARRRRLASRPSGGSPSPGATSWTSVATRSASSAGFGRSAATSRASGSPDAGWCCSGTPTTSVTCS